jgi:hypothetical protein
MPASLLRRPLQLLVLEAFAGTHPVGGLFQSLRQAAGAAPPPSHSRGLRPVVGAASLINSSGGKAGAAIRLGAAAPCFALAAYAAVELNPRLRAPGPVALGLHPTCHLGLNADVTSAETHDALLRFVRQQLAPPQLAGVSAPPRPAVDAVVVFGGRPCQVYSAERGPGARPRRARAPRSGR